MSQSAAPANGSAASNGNGRRVQRAKQTDVMGKFYDDTIHEVVLEKYNKYLLPAGKRAPANLPISIRVQLPSETSPDILVWRQFQIDINQIDNSGLGIPVFRCPVNGCDWAYSRRFCVKRHFAKDHASKNPNMRWLDHPTCSGFGEGSSIAPTSPIYDPTSSGFPSQGDRARYRRRSAALIALDRRNGVDPRRRRAARAAAAPAPAPANPPVAPSNMPIVPANPPVVPSNMPIVPSVAPPAPAVQAAPVLQPTTRELPQLATTSNTFNPQHAAHSPVALRSTHIDQLDWQVGDHVWSPHLMDIAKGFVMPAFYTDYAAQQCVYKYEGPIVKGASRECVRSYIHNKCTTLFLTKLHLSPWNVQDPTGAWWSCNLAGSLMYLGTDCDPLGPNSIHSMVRQHPADYEPVHGSPVEPVRCSVTEIQAPQQAHSHARPEMPHHEGMDSQLARPTKRSRPSDEYEAPVKRTRRFVTEIQDAQQTYPHDRPQMPQPKGMDSPLARPTKRSRPSDEYEAPVKRARLTSTTHHDDSLHASVPINTRADSVSYDLLGAGAEPFADLEPEYWPRSIMTSVEPANWVPNVDSPPALEGSVQQSATERDNSLALSSSGPFTPVFSDNAIGDMELGPWTMALIAKGLGTDLPPDQVQLDDNDLQYLNELEAKAGLAPSDRI